MTARPALPIRYLVDRTGTSDPPAATYYVLDVVHDFDARVALQMLVRFYRGRDMDVRADELQGLLRDTVEAHRQFVIRTNPKRSKADQRAKHHA